jgi:hypothetical protein
LKQINTGYKWFCYFQSGEEVRRAHRDPMIEKEDNMRIMPRRSAPTPLWMRGIVVLLILSFAGCAGTNRARTYGSDSGSWLPAGAKIAIAEAYVDKTPSDQENGIAKRPDRPPIPSAGGGAVAGGVLGTVGGGLSGALYGFTCGPVFFFCVPVLAVVGAVAGGVVGAAKGAEAGATGAARYAKDESKDTGNAEQSSEMTPDARAALQVIEETISSLSPVPDRVKRLVAPLSDQPEYLIEFNPPEVRFLYFVEGSGYASNKPEADHAAFEISVQARIVRLSDKAVLARRLVVESVWVSPGAPQTKATANAITAKLDAALDVCAARFANYWTVPAIGAKNKQNASETASSDAVLQGTDENISESDASNAMPAEAKPSDRNSTGAAPATNGTRAAASDPATVELAHWDAVKDSQSDVELQGYLTQYPNGRFATVAKARLDAMQPAAPTPVMPVATAPGLIGTLVITDGLTKIAKTVSVTVVETNAEQTVYSTGDIIDKDGNILQLRFGDYVATVASGALWNVRARAGMQGTAKVKLNANGDGEVRWRVIAAGEGRFRVEADTYLRPASGCPYAGRWRLDYASSQPLPESYSAEHRVSKPSCNDTTNERFSADLTTR